jgi:hypothetical protein
MNYDATAPTIRVRIANGTPVHSIASGELALVTALPSASRKGHVMVGFPHSLIGLAPFVDASCQVLFTDTAIIAFDRDGKVILEGWRETTGPKLLRWPLLPQEPPPPDFPQSQLQLGPCTYGTQMESINAVRSIIKQLGVQSIHHLRSQSRLPPRVDALSLICDGLIYPQSQHWSLSTMPAWATRLRTCG